MAGVWDIHWGLGHGLDSFPQYSVEREMCGEGEKGSGDVMIQAVVGLHPLRRPGRSGHGRTG
jgi:hypothetical protein